MTNPSNPILDIKRVAERLLQSISAGIPTGYEGVSFNEPNEGLSQRCQFVINPPTDPVFPAGFHRENVQFQVFVSAPLDEGTTAVISRAGAIRDAFHKGQSFTENSTKIHILRTPQISGVVPLQDRIVCPVIISFMGEVYSD